jgi:hypothetical protein
MSKWSPDKKRRKKIQRAQREHDRKNNRALRKKSGKVNDTDPLVTFLYLLMRNDMSTGKVEELVREATIVIDGDRESAFSNGYLAQYAQHLAKRLRKR